MGVPFSSSRQEWGSKIIWFGDKGEFGIGGKINTYRSRIDPMTIWCMTMVNN